MGTLSKRWFEFMNPKQRESFLYYSSIARGPFRSLEVGTLTPLRDTDCSSVRIHNVTDKILQVSRGNSFTNEQFADGWGGLITIPPDGVKQFDVVDNAQELFVATTTLEAVTIVYECFGEQI